MKNLTSIMAVVVNMEIIYKLANYWYLVVFAVNVVICIIGIIRDFKKSGVLKIDDWAYLVKFGEDLKNYYERNQVQKK